MKAHCLFPLLLSLALGLSAAPALAQQAPPKPGEMSIGDAVSRVQEETNGRVLSAQSRRWDRHTEYRIKVLTPEGHVRVMTVPANGGNGMRLGAPETRNSPPARHFGGKEKH